MQVLSMMRMAPPRPGHEKNSANEVNEDDWLEYARTLIVRATGAHTAPGMALYAFDGETDVDLDIEEGESLVIFDGVEVPTGWSIVEQCGGGFAPRRGLVPQAYVKQIAAQHEEQEMKPADAPPAPAPPSAELAATRMQARQRGRRARKRTTSKVNGLLPAALYGLD